MLTNIYIKNFLLIEKMDIDFREGFNVITGETGAGKSVLVKAIQTCIGQPFYDSYKLNRDTDSTLCITLSHKGKNPAVTRLLSEYGIEEDTIIIRRSLTSSGKSKSFINDIPASSSLLKKLAPLLFEIYRQNENQLLLNCDYQLQILDSLAGIETMLNVYADHFHHYQSLKRKIEALKAEKHTRERTVNNLEYEIGEIKRSEIRPGEYESLKEKKKIQKNMIIITKLRDSIMSGLYESENSIYAKLGSIAGDLESLSGYIASLGEYPKKINDFYYMIQDIVKIIDESLIAEDTESGMDILEERMNTLENLFKKYGDTEKDVLDYLQQAEQKLNELQNTETDMQKWEDELSSLEKAITEKACEISRARTDCADNITRRIMEKLKEMCMDNALFDIKLEQAQEISGYTVNGRDRIEFAYSPHYNIAPLPLSQITSGGELSRISLAVRSIFKSAEDRPISIFDEIDNGIGGETANKIGVLLREMASNGQVIVITHLPQIAKYSRHHIFIEKSIKGDFPVITSMHLDKTQKEAELLRMLGGMETVDEAIKNKKDI